MKLMLAAALVTALAVPAMAADNDVMAADRAFSKLSVEKGEAFAFWTYSSKSARMYGPSGPPQIGRAAKAPPAEKGEATLSWAPTAGAVSEDGKMGWTDGAWKMSGARGTLTGHYVTVWVKEDGAWKVQADIGTAEPPPGPPPGAPKER